MAPKLMWCLFLFVFAAMIGGIHSYGWWTRQAAAQASPVLSTPSSKGGHVQVVEPLHWRSLVMHQ